MQLELGYFDLFSLEPVCKTDQRPLFMKNKNFSEYKRLDDEADTGAQGEESE